MEMALSCDRLDANTSNEGKSHRQIPFEGGIALARTKGPSPELKQWLTELLKENVEQLSMREWPSLEANLKSTGRQSSLSCSKKITSSNILQQCSATTRNSRHNLAHVSRDVARITRVHGWNHAGPSATGKLDDMHSVWDARAPLLSCHGLLRRRLRPNSQSPWTAGGKKSEAEKVKVSSDR